MEWSLGRASGHPAHDFHADALRYARVKAEFRGNTHTHTHTHVT